MHNHVCNFSHCYVQVKFNPGLYSNKILLPESSNRYSKETSVVYRIIQLFKLLLKL